MSKWKKSWKKNNNITTDIDEANEIKNKMSPPARKRARI